MSILRQIFYNTAHNSFCDLNNPFKNTYDFERRWQQKIWDDIRTLTIYFFYTLNIPIYFYFQVCETCNKCMHSPYLDFLRFLRNAYICRMKYHITYINIFILFLTHYFDERQFSGRDILAWFMFEQQSLLFTW